MSRKSYMGPSPGKSNRRDDSLIFLNVSSKDLRYMSNSRLSNLTSPRRKPKQPVYEQIPL